MIWKRRVPERRRYEAKSRGTSIRQIDCGSWSLERNLFDCFQRMQLVWRVWVWVWGWGLLDPDSRLYTPHSGLQTPGFHADGVWFELAKRGWTGWVNSEAMRCGGICDYCSIDKLKELWELWMEIEEYIYACMSQGCTIDMPLCIGLKVFGSVQNEKAS